MQRIKTTLSWFLKIQIPILIHWPCLTLFSLLALLSLCLEYPFWSFYIFFIIVFLNFALVYLRSSSKKRFLVITLIFISAISLFFLNQNPLSKNLFPKKCTYVGFAIKNPVHLENTSKLLLDLKERISPLPSPVSGRIILTIGEKCVLSKGDKIEFQARVKEPTSYHNPGVFDYKRYLRRQGIWGKTYVHSCESIKILHKAHPDFLEKIRNKLTDSITADKTKNKDILLALLLGTKTITSKNKTLIRNTGVSHLFVISGTHFGVMCAMVFFIASLLSGFIPRLYLTFPKQKIAAFFTIIFASFYLILVSSSPSVNRAGLMVLLFLLSLILNRQKHFLYILIISASFNLLWNPLELYNCSFQFSYLCVLILAFLYPRLAEQTHLKDHLNICPKPIQFFAHIFFISLLINLLLMPLVLFHFGETPLLGFLNNLWAIPYFCFIVIPLGLLYLVSFFIFPLASSFVLSCWDISITIFLKILFAVDQWNMPKIGAYTPHLIHVLLFYLMVFSFFLIRKKRGPVILGFVLLAALFFTWHDQKTNFDFKMTQIDVGQGDAILLQTKNKNVLIDTGGNRYFDIGQRVLTPYFRHKWVHKIDLVVLTHPDIDHYGGLEGLLESFEIGEVWINGFFSEEISYQRLLRLISEQGVPLKIVQKGFSQKLDQNTSLKILSPLNIKHKPFNSQNDQSIVIMAKHGDYRTLLTGDLSRNGEKQLIETYGNGLKADILKVAHHGSRSSTTSLFLKKNKPDIALIGVGKNLGFGHPHHDVIKRLEKHGATILRTDKHGACGVVVKNGKVEIFRTVD